MNGIVSEGQDVLIPSLGIVHVVKVYPSGAAVCMDQNGIKWLCSTLVLRDAELCLFS